MEEQCFEVCSHHANLIFPSSQETAMPNTPDKNSKMLSYMPCIYDFFIYILELHKSTVLNA